MSIRTYIPPPPPEQSQPTDMVPGSETTAPPPDPEMVGRYVEPQEVFDPDEHTVDEVKEYITDNPDKVEEILEAEGAGKNRSTLVAWLEEQEPPAEEPA